MFNKLRDTDVEAFDSYLKGKMKEDELNAFKLRLANDASFRDSYLLYKMIIDKVKADAEVTATLKQRLFKVSKRSQRYTWLKWLTGTAAILVISFFAIKVTQHKQADYSKYMFDEPGLTVQMSAGTENKWASFNNAFAQKDYQECLELLKKIGSNDNALYHTGVCNEFLKQNEKAAISYQELNTSNNTLLRNKANYRNAILLLNSGDKSKAIKVLNEISVDTTSPYKPEAMKVLEAINGKK